MNTFKTPYTIICGLTMKPEFTVSLNLTEFIRFGLPIVLTIHLTPLSQLPHIAENSVYTESANSVTLAVK